MSSINTNGTVLIVSSNLAPLGIAENTKRHNELTSALKALQVPYVEVIGRYKGMNELSVMVSAQYERVVHSVMRDYEQEAYLEVHHDNATYLVKRETPSLGIDYFVPEFLGYMTHVTQEEAETLDAYTYRPDTESYYVVTPKGI